MNDIKTGDREIAKKINDNFKELSTGKVDNSTATNFLGNASTATKLKTAYKIGLSGDVSGTATAFDGSKNISIPVTLPAFTQANTTSTVSTANGGTVTALDSLKTDAKGRVTGVNTKTITLPPAQTSVSGNAGSATKLQTARLIGGVSFDGTANIDLAGVNKAGNQDTSGNAGSATKLKTARTINGVGFDGTGNITITANPSVGAIPENADLNNYKTSGFYNAMGVAGIKNKPSNAAGTWFTLLVQNIGAANACQIYFDTNTAQLFIRKLSNTTAWGNWVAISDSNGLILDGKMVRDHSYWFQSTELTTWNTTQLFGKYFIPAWQWLDNRPYTEGSYMVEVSGNYNQWLQEARSFDYTKKPLYRTFDGSVWTEWRNYN